MERIAIVVIPAPDYEIRGQAPSGIQTPSLQAVSSELFKELDSHFHGKPWIPDKDVGNDEYRLLQEPHCFDDFPQI